LSPALERAVARGFGPEAAARPLEEDHCHTNENGGCNEIYPVYRVVYLQAFGLTRSGFSWCVRIQDFVRIRGRRGPFSFVINN